MEIFLVIALVIIVILLSSISGNLKNISVYLSRIDYNSEALRDGLAPFESDNEDDDNKN